MLRSHSTAYPQTGFLAKLSYLFRQHNRAVVATLAFFAFVFVISLDSLHDKIKSHGLRAAFASSSGKGGFGGAAHDGYFKLKDSVLSENSFRFAAVTDLDELSRLTDSKKPKFRSELLPGTIERDPQTNKYSIHFDPLRRLTSMHNEGGRGMELSELTLYQDRLLAFDDRTGSVFEVLNEDQGKSSFVVPRFVVTEGEGDTDKGMKWEWASVKDGELYMGSMGKEYTDEQGNIKNRNNLWVSILSPRGELRRVNWSDHYMFVRKALGATPPGYVINEAILWSSHLQKWVFLPRRISSEQYNDVVDERKGSNKLLLVDEKFTTSKVVEITMSDKDPLHGFSTFAFVPNTKDRHALAVRTVEEDCVGGEENRCKQRSYFVIFDVLTGEVLMDEVKYTTDGLKFEGVEFVNIYTPEKQQ